MMRSPQNQCVLVLSLPMVCLGIYLSIGSTPRELALIELMNIYGGAVGVELVDANCPDGLECTTKECDDDGNGNHTCADNTVETEKTRETIPFSTQEGYDWKTTAEESYKCGDVYECSNPCLQGTVTGKYFCGPRVGGDIGDIDVTGKKGDEALDPEA